MKQLPTASEKLPDAEAIVRRSLSENPFAATIPDSLGRNGFAERMGTLAGSLLQMRQAGWARQHSRLPEGSI